MSKPELSRLIDLQSFLLQFRAIKRVVYLPSEGSEDLESDVDHSYSLAMVAWYLCQYFPHLDRDKAMRYAMAHDLVEVHAGDTYIFAADGSLDTKKEREHAALQQIKKDWTDFPEMCETIEAYETKSDEESRFIYALDKIMPMMVGYLAEGYGWHKHQLTLDVLHEHKKDKVTLSPEIDSYYQQLYALLQQNPQLFPDLK